MKATPEVLKRQDNWQNLFFYRKSDALYLMTRIFCERFLPKHGDRTVDQMVQAARSGKQNIVEGLADGVTSTEMELRLLNVARASIKELREDYSDYLKSHGLEIWNSRHKRYRPLAEFCRAHNDYPDYEPFVRKWTDEEFANCALALCHLTDKMMTTFIAQKAADFTENGGIKERMTAARLGRRQTQNEEIAALKARIRELEKQLAALRRAAAQESCRSAAGAAVGPD